MSIIQHHIVSGISCNPESIEAVKEWINRTHYTRFFTVTEKLRNGYTSIIMCPDGSNEGWAVSNLFDDLRMKFIKKLNEYNFKWVCVEYGDEGTHIYNCIKNGRLNKE